MQQDARDAMESERGDTDARSQKPGFLESLGLSERFVEMGKAAGFDMYSLAGVAAWSAEYKRRIMSGQPLEAAVPKADKGLGQPPRSQGR